MYCTSHIKENVLHPTCSIKTFNQQRSLILRWNLGTLVGRVLFPESRGGIRLLLQTESCADRILAISGWWRQRRPLTLRAAISSSLPIWETTDQRSRLPASEYPVKGTCWQMDKVLLTWWQNIWDFLRLRHYDVLSVYFWGNEVYDLFV